MRERLLGRQLERGKLGSGGARGEGTAPAGHACRYGGVAERHWSRVRAQRGGRRAAAVTGWEGRSAGAGTHGQAVAAAMVQQARVLAAGWWPARLCTRKQERSRGGRQRSEGRERIDFNFSQTFKLKLKKFWIRKVFKIQNSTTFVSGTNSFEA